MNNMYNFIDQSHRQGICILYMFKHFDSVYLTLQKKSVMKTKDPMLGILIIIGTK